jgi:hypothetical protein
MSEDLDSQIEQAADDPQLITVDGTTVQSRPIPELIEADKYLASKRAATARKPGFRLFKLTPPGMTD